MKAVDCTCDRGDDGGICANCLGVGWYVVLDSHDLDQLAAETN